MVTKVKTNYFFDSKDARAKQSAKSLQFLMLEIIGYHGGLFAEDSTKFRGRKPDGYPYNLTKINDDVQLKQVIYCSNHKYDT